MVGRPIHTGRIVKIVVFASILIICGSCLAEEDNNKKEVRAERPL